MLLRLKTCQIALDANLFSGGNWSSMKALEEFPKLRG